MKLATRTHVFALLGAIAVVTPLAGCAGSGSVPATSGSSEGSGSGTSSGTYTDGTYTQNGSYQSPNGTETIEVTLTLAENTITNVAVVGEGVNPNSVRFQNEFSDGIAEIVVGKNIDDVVVDRVAGSSLTSGGFEDALSKIKADALS
ncbi:MAG: FMN-binding protein [Microbacteriaceae bacterium]